MLDLGGGGGGGGWGESRFGWKKLKGIFVSSSYIALYLILVV